MTIISEPGSGLKTRAVSAAILGAVFLTLLYFGGGAYALLLSAASAVSAYEWGRMTTAKDPAYPKGLAYLSAIVAFLGTVATGMVDNPVIALWFIFALCFLVYALSFAQKGPSVKIQVAGIIYISFAFGVMIWLRNGASHGLYHTLTLMLIVWGSDIAAYFTGRTLGGPKLAPSISPKKTWSGFIGSSLGAGALAGALACPWVVAKLGVTTIGGMGSVGYFILGFILAMFGQAGDLLISVFKRHYEVKDTGTLIPGHGGVLDRADALIFVALFFSSLVMILA
jgi:phosphatidate cytidylyltransferase